MGLNDTISFTCSACGHTADFPKAQEGKAIYCPQCQAAQVVKGTGRYEVERIDTGRIAKADNAPGTDRIVKSAGGIPARIDFTCGACNHTSRISSNLSGQPVRCPACGTVQLAGVSGMRVARIDANGKLPFTCTACAYQARLSPEYAGKAIRCPKCQGAQVVPRIVRETAPVEVKPPGTGSIRKDPQLQRTPAAGTLAASPPPAAPTTPSLKTPPPLAQLPMPTPAPGSLKTPPPEPPQVSAEALRTPLPTPMSEVEAAAAREAIEDGNFDPSTPAEQKRGGVVRRSGRMGVQRGSPPPPPASAEPTLEPARAIQVAAEGHAPEVEPEEKPAPPRAPRPPPAWLTPVLGVASVLLLVVVVVLMVLYSSATSTAGRLGRDLNEAQKQAGSLDDGLKTAKQELQDALMSRKLIEDDRDQLRSERDAQRKEIDQLKQDLAGKKTLEDERDRLRKEIERLKAEAKPASAPETQPRAK